MQKRKSHNKSRAGCQNCKKRHVKCDEQGPPCAACVVRKTTSTCQYSGKRSPPSKASSDGASPASRSSSEVSAWRRSPIVTLFEADRRLELELMHRWSTSTFKGFCGVQEDEHYLQVELPLCSLKYDFLLHGIMAIAALDIAMHGTSSSTFPSSSASTTSSSTTSFSAFASSSAAASAAASASASKSTAASSTGYTSFTPSDYARTAMEYYDRASVGFRAELADINQDNVHCIYMFSLFTVAINLALPQFSSAQEPQQASLLERMPLILDLICTCISFYARFPQWMQNSSLAPSLVSAEAMLKVPMPKLDPETEEALVRLKGIAEGGVYLLDPLLDPLLGGLPLPVPVPELGSAHTPGSGSGSVPASAPGLVEEDTSMTGIHTTATARAECLRKCVRVLRFFFEEDAKGLIKGLHVAFPALAGPDFTAAVKDSDPLSLLILLHWAVLVDRPGGINWWMSTLGSDLVQDVSVLLAEVHPELLARPEWRGGVDWARARVGLPPMW